MTTTVVNTIGSGARDYSTIAAWEDATDNTSLTAADEIRVGECYNDSEFVLTGPLAIAGATVDATRYRKITTATGQAFRDDAGAASNPQRYDQAQGVGIACSTSYLAGTYLIDVGENFFQIEKLQINHTGGGGDRTLNMSITGGVVRGLLIDRGGDGGGIVLTDSSKVINTLVIMAGNTAPSSRGGIAFGYTTAGSGAFNCTVVRPTGLSNPTSYKGITTGGTGTPVVKNCAVFGTFDFSFEGSFSASSGFNGTDQGSAPGSSNQTSLTYLSQFESIASGSYDFRAKASGSLANGTTDSSNTGDVDIVGQSRPGTPTIGSWEANPGGGGGGGGGSLGSHFLRHVARIGS